MGWLLDKRARLLQAYPSFTLRQVKYEMTGAQSWAWYNAAMENAVGAFGPLFRRTSDAYVRQETKRLMAMVKITVKKKK